MNETICRPPPALAEIAAKSDEMGFSMPSDASTGTLLRTLARTRSEGRLLELGTGTGLATAWLLDGMEQRATLMSVDYDESVLGIARLALASDPRVTFICEDGDSFLRGLPDAAQFDLIFADTWSGKYRLLDEALDHLVPGGLYIIDDMLPQPNWPPGHEERAAGLLRALHERSDLLVTELKWSTGIVLAVKTTPIACR
jgi:predicted O-methyltransferase YrrM